MFNHHLNASSKGGITIRKSLEDAFRFFFKKCVHWTKNLELVEHRNRYTTSVCVCMFCSH